ncbi:DUF2760 domain-containing protein [Candidatus Poribacteria bacterium]|nr:DUF2760 domain-containing protein [Candidatus Poribacteria bacterium]
MYLSQAIKAFFRVLSQGEGRATSPALPPPPEAFKASSAPAIQLLALLQKEGRLVDFLMEDIASFSDAEVGAAARAVHGGCRKVFAERLRLERILDGTEGGPATVPEAFDASAIALAGSVSGAGPHRGVLNHRGWRATQVSLPTVPPGADALVVAPAEVEVRSA